MRIQYYDCQCSKHTTATDILSSFKSGPAKVNCGGQLHMSVSLRVNWKFFSPICEEVQLMPVYLNYSTLGFAVYMLSMQHSAWGLRQLDGN